MYVFGIRMYEYVWNILLSYGNYDFKTYQIKNEEINELYGLTYIFLLTFVLWSFVLLPVLNTRLYFSFVFPSKTKFLFNYYFLVRGDHSKRLPPLSLKSSVFKWHSSNQSGTSIVIQFWTKFINYHRAIVSI